MQSQQELKSRNEQITLLLKTIFKHPTEIEKINSLFYSFTKESGQIALFTADYQKKIDEYIILKLLTNDDGIDSEIQLLKSHGLISPDAEEIFYTSQKNGCNLKNIYAKFPEALQQFIVNMAKDNFTAISNREVFFNLFNQIFSSPEISMLAAPHFAKLNWVRFGANGACSERWSTLADAVIRQSNLHKHHPQLLLKPAKVSVKIPDTYHFDSKEWKLECLLGRTVLFKNSHNNMVAFKIQKKDESEKELQREFHTASYLKKHANVIKLQSAIHEPKAIVAIPDMKIWLNENALTTEEAKQLSLLVDFNKTNMAYIYEVPQKENGCFTYLHDITISDQDFRKANRIIVNDLIRLLKYGFYYHQLADIFHTQDKSRYDKGRYRMFVNLINKTNYGKGRLDQWLKAVEWCNLRKTGLVDWGDWIPLAELFNNQSDFVRNNFGIPYSGRWVHVLTPEDNIGNLALVNTIAEYLFVLELCAGRRGRMLSQIHPESQKIIWANLAELMLDNCAQALGIFFNISEYKVRDILTQWISLDRYAEQMQFWMTDQYIPYVAKDTPFPSSLYGPEVDALSVIARYHWGTFNEKTGCACNEKDPDLGPYNGQFPIKEEDKLFHVVAIFLLIIQNQHDLNLEKLAQSDKAISEKDYFEAKKSLEKCNELFKQAPRKHVKTLHRLNELMKEEKPGQKRDELNQLIQFHRDGLTKYYGNKWLSCYRAKSVSKDITPNNHGLKKRKSCL